MAESTLTQSLDDIKSELGQYLGISRTTSDWTSENTADVARIIKSGQRQFYGAHTWSFLRANLSLAITTATTDLPDAFDGFPPHVKRLSFTSTKAWSLLLVPIDLVNEKIQDYGSTAPSGSGITQPLLAAVQPKSTAISTTGQRWQIVVWPTPLASLTLTGPYRVRVDALSASGDFVLGGAHAQTFLESCLACAEEFQNDQTSTVHRDKYQELLSKSIELDVKLHKEEHQQAA